LSMPLEERRARHQVLFHVISDNDLDSWGAHFLATLSNGGPAQPLHEQLGLGPAVTAGVAYGCIADAAKQASASKRGQHSQSSEPLRPSRAAASQSPISA